MTDTMTYEMTRSQVDFFSGLTLSDSQWGELSGYMRDTLNEAGTWTIAPTILDELGLGQPEWLELPTGGSDEPLVLIYTVSREDIQNSYKVLLTDEQWSEFSETLYNALDSLAQNDLDYILFELLELERP